jgi:hypothetical protein
MKLRWVGYVARIGENIHVLGGGEKESKKETPWNILAQMGCYNKLKVKLPLYTPRRHSGGVGI